MRNGHGLAGKRRKKEGEEREAGSWRASGSRNGAPGAAGHSSSSMVLALGEVQSREKQRLSKSPGEGATWEGG